MITGLSDAEFFPIRDLQCTYNNQHLSSVGTGFTTPFKKYKFVQFLAAMLVHEKSHFLNFREASPATFISSSLFFFPVVLWVLSFLFTSSNISSSNFFRLCDRDVLLAPPSIAGLRPTEVGIPPIIEQIQKLLVRGLHCSNQ